jgi:hypothetical protein
MKRSRWLVLLSIGLSLAALPACNHLRNENEPEWPQRTLWSLSRRDPPPAPNANGQEARIPSERTAPAKPTHLPDRVPAPDEPEEPSRLVSRQRSEEPKPPPQPPVPREQDTVEEMPSERTARAPDLLPAVTDVHPGIDVTNVPPLRAEKNPEELPSEGVARRPAATTGTAGDPSPLERYALLGAFYEILEDRPERALELLKSLNARDQDLALRLLPILAQAQKRDGQMPPLSSEDRLVLLDSMRSMMMELQVAAPLEINRLVFCKEVKGYGVYEPVAVNQFKPGEPILIYAEVENLVDHKEDGHYVVNLTSTLEIRDASCREIRSRTFPVTPSKSTSFRTDHFIHMLFQIPAELSPGCYTLNIRISDQDTKREVEKKLTFHVVHVAAKGIMP